MDKMPKFEYPQELIASNFASCEQQVVEWRESQPGKWAINDPYQSEKGRVFIVLVGYIGRMIELYNDTREAFDDEKYLAGVILSRAFVETASMTCLFHKQMHTHFNPSPSDEFQGILDRHMFAAKHQFLQEQDEQIKPYHILKAIEAAEELADEVRIQRKQKYDIGDNIEILVPGAEAIDYKLAREAEARPFDWIYGMLSEISHPNPLNRHRYISSVDDSVFSDEMMKFLISKGVFTMFYASIATDYLINLVKDK